MRVSLPYRYFEEVPNRSGKTRQFLRVAREEGVVRETSREEAAVAASWSVSRREGLSERVVRWFEGDFYMLPERLGVLYAERHRVLPFHTVLRENLPTPENPSTKTHNELLAIIQREFRDADAGRKNISGLVVGSILASGGIPEEYLVAKEGVSSTRAADRRRIEAVIGDLLIVDDEVWVKVWEPRLFISVKPEGSDVGRDSEGLFAGRIGFGQSVPFELGMKLSSPDRQMFFGLSDRQGLDDALMDRGRGYREDRNPFHIQDVRISLPEVFVTDWDSNNKRRFLQAVVAGFGPDLGSLPAETLGAWIDIRQALVDHDAAGDKFHLDHAIANAVPGFLESLPGSDDPRLRMVRDCLALHPSSPAPAVLPEFRR